MKITIFIELMCCSLLIFQPEATAQVVQNEKIYQGVLLDEVMIKAVQSGFDVPAFVSKIKKDTTFYKAFKSLRLRSFTMYNDIQLEDKQGEVKASYNSLTAQHRKHHCRTMTVQKETITGDFYRRNGKYRYYTASLYAHLFFTKGTICNETNFVGETVYKGTTRYEEQLRMLIFNPGRRIHGIPGIGDQVAIFEEPYFSKYKFFLNRVIYNGEDCYLFKAVPKTEYRTEIVINELKTWIRVADEAIVARDYSLSYHTLFYDFDVKMGVKLRTIAGILLPYEVQYDGNWHVFGKSREKAHFTAIFTDFE